MFKLERNIESNGFFFLPFFFLITKYDTITHDPNLSRSQFPGKR